MKSILATFFKYSPQKSVDNSLPMLHAMATNQATNEQIIYFWMLSIHRL